MKASSKSSWNVPTAKRSFRGATCLLLLLSLGCVANRVTSVSQQESIFSDLADGKVQQPTSKVSRPVEPEQRTPTTAPFDGPNLAGNSSPSASGQAVNFAQKSDSQATTPSPTLRTITPASQHPSSRRVKNDQSQSSENRLVAWDPPAAEMLPAPTEPPQELPPRQFIGFPDKESEGSNDIRLSRSKDRISLTARDAPITAVLALIAEQHGLNIVAGEEVNLKISVTLNGVLLDDALDVILAVNGYTWSRHKNIVTISSVDGEKKTSPVVQGRRVHVFALNYVSATDVQKVVTGLLSPSGQSFTTQTNPADKRCTVEQIVVEDLPAYVERVAEYIAQVDCPPRQVIVEAHVLQVTLKDGQKHGVNFESILQVANSQVNIDAAAFAQGIVPTAILRINGTDLDLLLHALKSTTDSKTLASPKVAVLNGQTANMQVGGKIGYLLTTTTQTSTLQSVNFLDFGVLLEVTPIITADHQVLLQVKPQVSTGRINATTQLPESETTEVNTTVLLADGEALVIGGLIKESDSDSQNKWPFLGDLWLVGRLFQRREVARERNEIIITLLPRIVPEEPGFRAPNTAEIDQAHTPLFIGPLKPVDRRAWEPQLPDASRRRDRVPREPGYRPFDAASTEVRTAPDDESEDVGLERANGRIVHAAVHFPEHDSSAALKKSVR